MKAPKRTNSVSASEELADGMGLDAELFEAEPIYIGKRELPPGSVDAIGQDDGSINFTPIVIGKQ